MESWHHPLVEAGANVLHCSQRRFWEPEFPEVDGDKGMNFVGWAKKLTGAAAISVGSVGLSGDFMAAFGGEGSTSAGRTGVIHGNCGRRDVGIPSTAACSAGGHCSEYQNLMRIQQRRICSNQVPLPCSMGSIKIDNPQRLRQFTGGPRLPSRSHCARSGSSDSGMTPVSLAPSAHHSWTQGWASKASK